LRKVWTCRLDGFIIYRIEIGHFDIECVAQYPQNIRERLRNRKYLSIVAITVFGGWGQVEAAKQVVK
jgi:hypothetical protein